MTKKSSGKVLLQGVLGIIVFLLFVGILNLINMKFKHHYYSDQLKITNPKGDTGILTLWNNPSIVREKLDK